MAFQGQLERSDKELRTEGLMAKKTTQLPGCWLSLSGLHHGGGCSSQSDREEEPGLVMVKGPAPALPLI